LVLGLASLAWAGIPDLDESYAFSQQASQVSVYSLPNGGGDGIDDCYLFGGTKTDATITLYVLDINGDPIYLYPFADLWLETNTPGVNPPTGMVLCPGGSTADQSTDENGMTTFSNPVFGCAHGYGTDVMINGDPINQPPILMDFNSPDINGDQVCDLPDIAEFAGDYFGTYDYRSDFFYNGTLNIQDIALLAQGLGSECP
jgi:hypothetical protein